MTVASLPRAVSPTPFELWLHFNEPQFRYADLRKRFGALAPGRFDQQDHVMVLTAEGAQQVFAADPANYDAFFKDGFTAIAGPASLWTLTGAAHRRERQLFTPVVYASHLSQYANIVHTITRAYLEKWQPGRNLKAFDTTRAISRDVILRLVFGIADGPLMDEGREIMDELSHASNPLIVFVARLQRSWFPPWRRYARAKQRFGDWVNRFLAERRAQGGATDDVIGNMLAARYEDGSPMQDNEIRDELITVLIGGHETTAAVLAWALYELGRDPARLAKLQAELDNSGVENDISLAIKLPYLGAVCDEIVRLHPILAECARVLTEPMQVLGHTIAAGNVLIISILGIHHDPELYPEPERFKPERFLERTYSRSEFLPFGGAHRRCLGAALSEYETRIALAEIVLHWDFVTTGVDRDVRHGVPMGPKHGVPLRIKARRKPAVA